MASILPRPPRIRRRPRVRNAGFTLIEVMIAAAIFVIASAALVVAFRVGTRAWDAGHRASERMQTARMAQEIINRDLGNLYYRTEAEYNRTFRAQVQQMEQYHQKTLTTDRDALVERDRNEFLFMQALAVPIDLTFHGQDSGATDSIEFARVQRGRASEDRAYKGLRRIRYYVKEKTLYREESPVQGVTKDSNLIGQAGAGPEIAEQIGTRFTRHSPEDERPADGPAADFGPTLSEPLCEGVELFNITYGYYRGQKWNEVDAWDSAKYQYRYPLDELEALAEQQGGGPGAPGGPAGGPGGGPGGANGAQDRFAGVGAPGTESNFNPAALAGGGNQRIAFVDGQPVPYSIHPDDLPGYVAIQLGLREPNGKGKLQSFTFYFKLAQAQEEFDLTLADDGPPQGGRGHGAGRNGSRGGMGGRLGAPMPSGNRRGGGGRR